MAFAQQLQISLKVLLQLSCISGSLLKKSYRDAFDVPTWTCRQRPKIFDSNNLLLS